MTSSLGQLLRDKLAQAEAEKPKAESMLPVIYKAEIYRMHPYEDSSTDYEVFGMCPQSLHLKLVQEMTRMNIEWKPRPDEYSVFAYDYGDEYVHFYAYITKIELVC